MVAAIPSQLGQARLLRCMRKMRICTALIDAKLKHVQTSHLADLYWNLLHSMGKTAL